MTISPEMLKHLEEKYGNPNDPKERIIDETIAAIAKNLNLSDDEMQSFRVSVKDLAEYVGQGYSATDMTQQAIAILKRNELPSKKGGKIYKSAFAAANLLYQLNSGENMLQVRGRPVRGGVSRVEPATANFEGYTIPAEE